MSPSTIRKAIGAVKDQTSIGIAKVASNTAAPELEVAIVKATTHDNDPSSEKYIREIIQLTAYSHGYVDACVVSLSRRLGKTRDWIVALKCLMLVHRLLNEGDSVFQREIMYATRRGSRLLNLSDFREEAHSSSWDHSSFVRTYSLYLDQKLELTAFEQKLIGNGANVERSNRGYNYDHDEFRDESKYGMSRSRSTGDAKESNNEKNSVTPLREMKPERIFGKMVHLQRLLDRFLSCRPSGLAKNERMILVALYLIVKESFKLYADICEVLAVLLDKFFEMEFDDCAKAFDVYVSASKQIDELVDFYNWCKDIGIARSNEYPEVQKITSKLLETLEGFVRDRSKAIKSPERKAPAPREDPLQDMNEIKALPPPENYTPVPPPPPVPAPVPVPPKPEAVQEPSYLVDLRDEGVTADDQGNKFALALFSEPSANKTNANKNGSWEAFDEKPSMNSPWENPAAETGKQDWELALVESASHLSSQKAAMGGGMDPLLLNGMYDQGIVTQHTSISQSSGGSSSSVVLPGAGAGKPPVLALPAPDGTVRAVGGDPFAASLAVPPPAYVQMADMEKKQGLLVQEQMVWQQYSREGMQGQTSLGKIGQGGYYPPGYGMPPGNGTGFPPAGYLYGPY